MSIVIYDYAVKDYLHNRIEQPYLTPPRQPDPDCRRRFLIEGRTYVIIFDRSLPLTPELLYDHLMEALTRLRTRHKNPSFRIDNTSGKQPCLYLPDGAMAGWFAIVARTDSIRLQIWTGTKLGDDLPTMVEMTFYLLDIVYGQAEANTWAEKLPELVKQGGIQENVQMPSMGNLAQLAQELQQPKNISKRRLERLAKVNQLKQNGELAIKQIAYKLKVSEKTIQRDMDLLEDPRIIRTLRDMS